MRQKLVFAIILGLLSSAIVSALGGRQAGLAQTPASVPCSPCNMPAQNLTFSWTGSDESNHTGSLVYWPAGSTVSAPGTIYDGNAYDHPMWIGSVGGVEVEVNCTGIPQTIYVYMWNYGHGCFETFAEMDSYTCNPFFATKTIPDSGRCAVPYRFGFRSVTVGL